ncbi:hypothetical protein H8790_03835 [Oscillibacter hominis]|uniref:Uncharacterized protein n=1 Tax=Oscillibacter hominis TaxID=2763056 RepID=A0A7G9B6I3_9FIRM|nr:hypothetical protein [Oscillibacter hominis]QNL45164.1 hypothetical protein H8790_03835 [Oscillibacter hominis]
MADIISFSEFAEEPDLDAMSREQLADYLEAVQEQIKQLDREEPEDMESESYENWGDRHEELEDLADEILERLER